MDLHNRLINMYMSDLDWKHVVSKKENKKITNKNFLGYRYSYTVDCIVYERLHILTELFASWSYHLPVCLGFLLLLFLLAAPLSCSLACSRCFLAVSWVGSSRKVWENSSIASLKFFCSAFTTPAEWIAVTLQWIADADHLFTFRFMLEDWA